MLERDENIKRKSLEDWSEEFGFTVTARKIKELDEDIPINSWIRELEDRFEYFSFCSRNYLGWICPMFLGFDVEYPFADRKDDAEEKERINELLIEKEFTN